jgi:hypothetical protein
MIIRLSLSQKPMLTDIRGTEHTPLIERRRFQRLGGTVADSHIKNADSL